jgi:hypothetical protein
LFLEQGRIMAALEARGAVISVFEPHSPLERAKSFLFEPRWVSISFFSYSGRVDLRLASQLPGVLQLHLSDVAVAGEEDAAALCRMAELMNVCMEDVRVPESLWGGLKSLRKLSRLTLENVHVGDDGVAGIAQVPSLQHLCLNNCGVTDTGLGHLSALRELSELRLRRSRVSAEGLIALKDLPKLEKLDVAYCGLTDASLKPLGLCATVWELDVSNNPITDRGLVASISQMEHLLLLDVSYTRVTDAGLRVFVERSGPVRHVRVTAQREETKKEK